MYHANNDQKKTGVTILFSGKADFESRKIIRNKERHYITRGQFPKLSP